MVITKIERQKKNPSRFSLYIDDEYSLGIHKEVLLEFGFRTGDPITDKILEEVKRAEDTRRARETALRLLSYRARSTHELQSRLKKKDIPDGIIRAVIASLKKSGLLNDLEFGRAFAHDKLQRKPMGREMLKQELRKRGLSNDDVESILSEVYTDDAEEAYALRLVSKRMERSRTAFAKLDPTRRRKRLADYLARRGFQWDVVKKAIDQALGRGE